MLSPKLLEILVCPDMKTPVVLASEQETNELNQKIVNGQVKNKAGAVVSEKVEQLLIREDKQVAYAVRNGIPVMLIDEGLII